MSDVKEIEEKLIMKHSYPVLSSALMQHRAAGMVMLLALVLYGCAAAKPRSDAAPASNTAIPAALPAAVITSEVRADFDAAMLHIKAEEYDAGIELLNKVVKAVPNAAIPGINLALAYKKTDKLKQAEDSLKLALTAEADNPVANNELALLYRKTGRFTEARQIYEKTLEKYPNFRIVHKNLGILCDLYMKDYECALKHYVFYSDVVQDDKTVKIWIADLQKRSGR